MTLRPVVASPVVAKILSNYHNEPEGCLDNLSKILMHGKLSGTGKMVILPVDQGFEHGPARSFQKNPAAYDPLYHPSLAVEAKLNAYAAPLGLLSFAKQVSKDLPLILKINSSNSWAVTKDQAITASVDDAIRLGCVAIGFTIYPGSDHQFEMIEEFRRISFEAKAKGLAVVLWAYPRGGKLSTKGEGALDVTAYSAHIAALLGAHIIKVKLPSAHIEQSEAVEAYSSIEATTLKDRVSHIMTAAFNGKRLVVFSGGGAKTDEELLAEIQAIKDGFGSGSIIGRNSFQRERSDAVKLLYKIIDIYLA